MQISRSNVKIELQAGSNVVTLPKDVGATNLLGLFAYAPKDTTVTYGGTTYKKVVDADPVTVKAQGENKLTRISFEGNPWVKIDADPLLIYVSADEIYFPCDSQVTITVPSKTTLYLPKNSTNGKCLDKNPLVLNKAGEDESNQISFSFTVNDNSINSIQVYKVEKSAKDILCYKNNFLVDNTFSTNSTNVTNEQISYIDSDDTQSNLTAGDNIKICKVEAAGISICSNVVTISKLS